MRDSKKKLIAKLRYKKYAPVGGIVEIARKLLAGSVTIRQLREQLSLSRECIRQDLISYVGENRYTNWAANKKLQKAMNKKPQTLSAEQAQRYLKSVGNRADYTDLRFLLGAGRAAGFNFNLKVSRRVRPKLYTSSGKPVFMRIAVPDGEAAEHGFGLHRFNISGAVTGKFPIAIFLLRTGAMRTLYIFRTSDLTKVRSLVLRYKYLDRKSKYSAALNDWAALNDV